MNHCRHIDYDSVLDFPLSTNFRKEISILFQCALLVFFSPKSTVAVLVYYTITHSFRYGGVTTAQARQATAAKPRRVPESRAVRRIAARCAGEPRGAPENRTLCRRSRAVCAGEPRRVPPESRAATPESHSSRQIAARAVVLSRLSAKGVGGRRRHPESVIRKNATHCLLVAGEQFGIF